MTPVVHLVAGRFARLADGTYLDLATAARAWLRVERVLDHRRPELLEAGEALMACRHPALAPYLDFGPLDTDAWFEASAIAPDRRATQDPPPPGRGDLARALRSAGVTRACLHDVPGCSRAVVSLLGEPPRLGNQPARAGSVQASTVGRIAAPIQRMAARLDGAAETGVRVWHLVAPPAADWRRGWRQLARAARLRGMVPIAAPALMACPVVGDQPPEPWLALLAGRALVVMHTIPTWSAVNREALARLLIVVGAHRTRGAVVLNVIRGHQGPPGSERLEPPAGLAMRGGGSGTRAVAVLVHERPAYAWGGAMRAPSEDAVLERAHDAEARGRPAMARRLLRRGGNRLRRRSDTSGSLRIAAALACACVRSGRLDEAGRVWDDAWKDAGRRSSIRPVLAAVPPLARAWIDDASLARAESLLTAVFAAGRACDLQAPPPSAALLAECACWQGRWAEARARGEDAGDVAGLAVACRAALALGDHMGALRAAAAAELAADHGAGEDARAAALCARLRIDAALGDARHAESIERSLDQLTAVSAPAAREVALTIAETRVQRGAALAAPQRRALRALVRAAQPRLARARARLALALEARGPTPALVTEVRRVVARTGARALLPEAAGAPWPARAPAGERPMVHDVIALLEACRDSPRPDAALARACALLSERLGAGGVSITGVAAGRLEPLARFGREPSADVVLRASTAPDGVAPAASPDGWQAAWPIRQGPAVVAVLGACWASGASRPTGEAQALARTAAAALAPLAVLARMPPPLPPGGDQPALIGPSDAMRRVRQAIERAAAAPFHVLIEGESGVGKELVARAIHAGSARRGRRFCALNCAALADDLVEAELFGHARGAFTGAMAERAGLFEDADGGTLFLDEVGELTARAQAKLLRAIQEGEIRRLGEVRTRAVDVRIVSATNRPLAGDVEAARFRADLRFRLDVIRVQVPPLRERPEDVAPLARHFWAQAASRVGSRAELGPEALGALARYAWPGNVRELQNVLAAAAVAAPRRGIVTAAALPAPVRDGRLDGVTLDAARRQFERGFVQAALARAGGCRSRAAAELGVTRQGLAKLVDRLGLVECLLRIRTGRSVVAADDPGRNAAAARTAPPCSGD